MLRFRAFSAPAVTVAVLSGCGGGTDAPSVATVVITPPSHTLFATGATAQLTAEARTNSGTRIAGVGFSWRSLEPAVTGVSAQGLVSALAEGTGRIVASAEDRADTALVTVLLSECGSSITPLALAVGQAHELTGAQRAELCLGGAGAEYVLIPYHANGIAAATAQLEVRPNGVNGAAGPPNPSVAQSATGGPAGDLAFERALRERELRELPARMPFARRWQRTRGATPLRDVIAAEPQVGEQIQLNAQAGSACANLNVRTGRVAAVTQRAVVVHDLTNPANGFTDEEYASIGVTFDTLVHPLDSEAFGEVGDIDGSGRVMMFFTRVVNELTPPNSGSFVGGFFFARDLFPKDGPPNEACAGSNQAEMFYMLVPDPLGQVNGNQRTKTFVGERTVATIAHEFQHLINASRRLFLLDAPFEDVFLNEGLSHIAEELLFYHAAGIAPRGNVAVATLQASPRVNEALAAYQRNNLVRVLRYVTVPESNSPFATNDDLATRGATWQFLRYAADRQLESDGNLWFRLVNSSRTGLANIGTELGADPLQLGRDFVVAQYADDAVPGIAAPFIHRSWHFRTMLPFVNSGNQPLRTRGLVDGANNLVTLAGGAAAYLRFGVTGPFASIRTTSQGGPPVAGVRITILRTK